jgi:hypothetical protein
LRPLQNIPIRHTSELRSHLQDIPANGVTSDIIDKETQEIRPEDGEVYTKMEDLADELPESSPRYILLSHPLTLVSAPGVYILKPY